MSVVADDDAPPRPRSSGKLIAFCALIAFWFVAFCALGTWQVQRLAWKRALIASTDARIHAAPVPAPGPEAWGRVKDLAYLRVRVRGLLLTDRETWTQAVSDSGPGVWVMTPLVTTDGFTVLVNRGFLDPEQLAGLRIKEKPREATITGLLRLSEPKGGFLQSNHPERDEWHSRDVAAIATQRGLLNVAPYFIDADAASSRGGAGEPKAGLTVVSFPDNHLEYAITWYGLAAMMIVCAVILVRSERAARSRS